ncbi:MAG: hypothetical protein Q7J98_03490 [Kiritimatiellia bacterium]|nr:hypothetical protein [Kiritimatiellia bacterium]
MIKCAQCGFDNSFGHLYCTQCKAKLDLGQITRESFLNPGKHSNYYRVILQSALLVIIVCFVLALWPVQPNAVKISGTELGKARNKLTQLQKGVAVSPVEFSEKEVNILFNHLIQEIRRGPNFKAGPVSIYAGQVIINPKILTIYLNYQVGPWVFDPVTIGPFRLTYKVTGRPEKGPDGLRFAARNGAIGHLPLPILGRNLGMARLKKIFLAYKNARAFLGGLEIIEMKKGSITVFGAK